MPTEHFGKRLLNTKQAAEYLGCSEGWLNNKRVYGGGPVFVRVGRLVRYDPETLESFSRAHQRISTSIASDLTPVAA